MTLSRLLGIYYFHLDTHSTRHADMVVIDIEVITGVGGAHTAGDMIRKWMLRVCRQLTIELDAVLLQAEHGLVATELRYLCCSVPCRAGSQFIALDQRHVCPALTSKVVQRGAASDTASNDDHTGV